MGCEPMAEVPFLDFSGGGDEPLQRGTGRWGRLSREVREAMERLGCFVVTYDGVPVAEMFAAMKPLFDLPPETKQKNVHSKPYFGYLGGVEAVPLYESLGVENATEIGAARAFTHLMWPEGNPSFCETMNMTSRKMLQLELLIREMLYDSFGVGELFEGHTKNTGSILRLMKYKAARSHDSECGLLAHRDKNIVSVLCQDGLGLQVQSKEGEWQFVSAPTGAFIVLAGESLKVWSNGRLEASNHRVVMRDKERYSFGIFSIPNDGWTMEIPAELVDAEHPLRFKPFNFSEYLMFYYSKFDRSSDENSVEAFAGITA